MSQMSSIQFEILRVEVGLVSQVQRDGGVAYAGSSIVRRNCTHNGPLRI
jgi:hypothetical protein